jgi:hypothetical protein
VNKSVGSHIGRGSRLTEGTGQQGSFDINFEGEAGRSVSGRTLAC